VDLIGHLAVIEESRLLTGEALWGTEALTAMFPNLAHCHQWAYASLWDAHRKTDSRRARIIQGHMICDWVIHYGPSWTPVRERVGWAYAEMPKPVARLDWFMDTALALGLTQDDPRGSDTREHLERDFGHTVVECALDLQLAERYSCGPRLDSICDYFVRLSSSDFAGQFVNQVFTETGGFTRESPLVLERTARDYARWARVVTEPYQFAALTILAKYDLEESHRSMDFALDFLARIARELDPSSTRRMVDQIVARIADPELAVAPGYAGPPADTGVRDDRKA
jgi:hypothetical protein